MKSAIVLAVGTGLLIAGTSAVAAPINYLEQWDSYTVGTGDPAYLANWPTLSGAPGRYEVVLNATGGTSPDSPPNTLKVPKDVTLGITHNLTTDAMSPGQFVVGTDSDMLEVGFITDFHNDPGRRNSTDAFVEISMGGAQAPAAGGTAADALAFGMTYGINGSSVNPWFFDGINWHQGTSIATDKRWNLFRLQITSTSVTLIGERKASGSQSFARAYTGGFDTIALRTIDNDGAGQARAVDDLWVTGGNVVPEPASLLLLALGALGLPLRRRS